MSRPQKKIRESVHFKTFQESHINFPEGEIVQGEKPDFIIQNGKKVIGIEHTEIYRDKKSDGTTLQSEENFIFDVLLNARRIYNKQNNLPLVVRVDFNTKCKLKKERINELAQIIVNTVNSNIPKVGGEIRVRRVFKDKFQLPKETHSIIINHYKGRTKSAWVPHFLGGAFPKLTKGQVQRSIDNKAKKVKSYLKHCEEIWLLIVIDGFLPSTWLDVNEKALSVTYKSKFDKLYLLDFQRKKSYLLKSGIGEKKFTANC